MSEEIHKTPGREVTLHDQIMESKMWGEIRRLAPSHPALQDALDRVIVIYNLVKERK